MSRRRSEKIPDNHTRCWLSNMYSFQDKLEVLRLAGAKTDEELITGSVYFLRNKRVPLMFERSEKDNKKSTEYRNNGNTLLSVNKDIEEVAEMYTKSIAYALPKSLELSLAYANRSAVLFRAQHYEQCLLDIGRALQNNYPDNLKAKLFARQVGCLRSLKASKSEIEESLRETRKWLPKMGAAGNGRNLVEATLANENPQSNTTKAKKTKKKPTITYDIPDDNPEIPGASSAIKISYSPEYGQHLTATRDIKPGEMLMAHACYSSVLYIESYYRYCANCRIHTMNGIPCDTCVNTIYCTESCREEAWLENHDIECDVVGYLLGLGFYREDLLVLRMAFQALKEAGSLNDLEALIKKIDAVSDPRERGFTDGKFDIYQYASVRILSKHSEKRPIWERYLAGINAIYTTFILATKTELFGKKYDDPLKAFQKDKWSMFFTKLLLLNRMIVNTFGNTIAIREECKLGPSLSIRPVQGLINHSCNPLIGTKGDEESLIVAIRPIKEGEQLLESHALLWFAQHPKDFRQEALKNIIFKACDCLACERDWPTLLFLPPFSENKAALPGDHKTVNKLGFSILPRTRYHSVKECKEHFDDLVKLIEITEKYGPQPYREGVFAQSTLLYWYSKVMIRE